MRRLVVEADGGSRGNPGPAGYGALVRDAGSGEVLVEVAEGIGRATNNVAEYRGLLAGLAAAAEFHAPAEAREIGLEVRMDSKLVVEQMSGRWKVKHADLRPLAARASQLAEPFAEVTYRWVPRERNARADRLANDAMDAAAKGKSWSRHAAADEVTLRPPAPPAAPGPPQSATPGPARSQRGRTSGWLAATAKPTAMVLLRHGQTPLSVDRCFSGTGEAELTSTGEAQARAAGATLRARGDIEAVVSSPLSRARRTAQLVAEALGLPVTEDGDLRETDFGDWEGAPFAEVRERWPEELDAWLADPAVAPPGGESFAETTERVIRARDALLERYPGRTVLVVSHVTPIKTLVRDALLAPLQAVYRMHLDVACLCEVHWYADGPAMVCSLNDTGHLVG